MRSLKKRLRKKILTSKDNPIFEFLIESTDDVIVEKGKNTVIIQPMKLKHFFHTKKIWLICGLLLTQLFFGPNHSQAKNNENELFLVAQKAFQDGFYDVAIRYIDQLIIDFPETQKRVQANLLLGQCYFFQSQYLKAYDIFNELLNYTDYKDATLFWLGETFLKGADYKQAEKQYKQLLSLYPKSTYAPQALYSLGWNYFDREMFSEAKAMFVELITNFPEHQLSEDAAFKLGETEYNLQNFEDAIDFFSRYVFEYDQSRRKAEAFFYIGESYYYLENHLDAVTYYAKAAELAYDKKLTLMSEISLGWCYLKLGKYNLSEQHFALGEQFALDKNITSDDVYLGQASLFSETKEYAKAIKAYDLLLKSFPNSKRTIDAFLGKANIHYLLKEYEKAAQAYLALIDNLTNFSTKNSTTIEIRALNDIFEKAYFGLAWSYLKDGLIDKSIETFETIKNKTSNNTVKISALTQIGDAYQDIEQLQKAIDVYDQILKTYPDSIYIDYVQYRQGIALLKMDKIEAATLSFQTLKSNFKNSKYLHDVHYYLGVAYFKKDDWVAAKSEINKFIEDQTTNQNNFLVESYFILGLSEFNLSLFDEALKTFKTIVKNFPDQKSIVRKAEINIAKCFAETGKIKEALKKFKILLFKYPRTEIAQEALIWLGNHYLEKSDYMNAIAYYVQFTEMFPGSENIYLVYYELGQALHAQGEYGEAINTFKNITNKENPELFAKAQLAIADIFSQKFDGNSAMATYEDIIETSPEYKRDAYIKIAQLQKQNSLFQESLETYKKAKAADIGQTKVSDAECQFYIADTYELLNQKEKAVDEFLRIAYLYPDEVQWIIKGHLHVARIFEDKEKWEEAKIIYNKIIKYNTEKSVFAQERLEIVEENLELIKKNK